MWNLPITLDSGACERTRMRGRSGMLAVESWFMMAFKPWLVAKGGAMPSTRLSALFSLLGLLWQFELKSPAGFDSQLNAQFLAHLPEAGEQ